MPLSRRMRLAAREWLWRIQIATSRIRSTLTAAAGGGRSASISAREGFALGQPPYIRGPHT